MITFFTKDDGGGGDSDTGGGSGPSQSDVHVDSIIGAFHSFQPGPGGDCKKCGKSKSSHVHKSLTPPPTDFIRPIADIEEDNEKAAPGMEFLPVFPRANPKSPKLGRGVTSPPATPKPAAFHEPLTKSTNRRTSLDDQSSGSDGTFVTRKPQHYDAPGRKVLPHHMASANNSPFLGGRLPQDGPVFGAENPGGLPASQIPQVSSHQASPDIQIRVANPVHHFGQCPQCGVGLTGSESHCPNPQCGHDLTNDASSSYDHWEQTGGVSKTFLPICLSL